MYLLEKKFTFEAGHSLKHHQGHCQSPHGHSYQMTLYFFSPKLNEAGSETNMVIDFNKIGSTVMPLMEQFLDHHWLNETLQTDSPTAEFIAKWVFDKLESQLPSLVAVTIAETATGRATYFQPKFSLFSSV